VQDGRPAQITGALVDGPLALDNAIDLEAARIKKIDSPVAGRANVLLVPTSRPATCWPRACRSSRAPTPPASCSGARCRSSSPAAPTR
jgi:hypothetical protein